MSREPSRRREPEDLQHQAEHARPRRKTSVFGYLAILFAVAFLMLLMAYFQQQRQNDQTTDALKQSVSAVDTLQKLMEDNNTLREENAALRDQVDELMGQIAELDSARRTQNLNLDAMSEALSAMDYFWQIDEAYALKKYPLCRQLIEELGEGAQYLPDWKATDNTRFSPAARYQEIYNALY